MDFLAGLNPQQREAAAHVEGPLLILAGAGSGKTRVITHRIAHLVTAHHIHPHAILAVTFTNKAAEEMRSRIGKLLNTAGAGAGLPNVSTFHSFCVRLLRRDGASLADIRPNFTRQFTIYDDDDQLAIVKSVYKALGLDEKFMQYRAALSAVSQAKNLKQTPGDMYAKATDPKTSRLATIYERYEERLISANALDFDDLLLESVRLLYHDAAIREAWNRRIEFLMIDEYQDTNRSQYELMRLLSQARSNVCVVGDEDQSIYGWRGADIRNILDFERDFAHARVIRLEQNYRSSKNILEGASALVANNTERKGKWLWTEAGSGSSIGFYQASDAENEALFIADTIERAIRKDRDIKVAVLYRTNFQSRQIEEALRRYGRAYKVVGGFSFYQRAEIKDLLAYLKAAASPQDSISLLRIVNTPARGIGKTTVEQIEQYALQHNLSVWSAIERMLDEHMFGGRAESALSAFRRILAELNEGVTERPIDQTLRLILDRTGYEKMLSSDPSPETQSRLENVEELLNAAAEAVERGETITEFLDHAALVADADQIDTGAQVSLLTLHNAKGLEFPLVFLAGMEEGLFPHSRSLNTPGQMEEERRLCYVGMTRAEQSLYMTWAKSRRRYGGGPSEPTIPSRFLSEVPRSLVENLHEEDTLPQVDLYSERSYVREGAKRNLYTGKTYNSLENIQQFFRDRGTGGVAPAGSNRVPSGPGIGSARYLPPTAAPATKPASGAPPLPPAGQKFPPQASSGAQPAQRPATAIPSGKPGAPPMRTPGTGPAKGLRYGATIRHPKYGTGTVLRREGEGDDAKLTVSFPGHGLKKLVEKYAGIQIDE